jgi:hypothetical protein
MLPDPQEPVEFPDDILRFRHKTPDEEEASLMMNHEIQISRTKCQKKKKKKEASQMMRSN